MLLAIDVGNTNTCFGIYEGETLRGTFRLRTDRGRTADEIGLYATEYFQRFGLDMEAVEDVIIASVVPQVMAQLTRAMELYFGHTPMVIDGGVDPGLVYAIQGRERLGPDRSVACLAARELFPCPCIILDFGTATTLDALNEKGEYMGGCIAAGLETTARALSDNASLLPQIELKPAEKVLGTTTVGQIQAGVVLGYVGAMEYLVRRARQELGVPDCPVIATGGLAGAIAQGSELIRAVDRDLVLEGLRLIYQREKKQR